MLAGTFLSLLKRSPSSIHRILGHLPRGPTRSVLPRNSTNCPGCLGGCPNGAKSGPRSGSVYVVHLSRICLGTTRTTFGLNKTRGLGFSLSYLGTVIDHTGPIGSIKRSRLDLRHVLGRHHGRLMKRKRTFFSTVQGNLPIDHANN